MAQKRSKKATLMRLARDPRVQRAVLSAIPILIGLLRSRKARKKK